MKLGRCVAAIGAFLLLTDGLSRAAEIDLSSGSWMTELSGRSIALDESYALALKRSETIARSSDAVRQALSRIDELKSDILPQISLNAQDTLQENPNLAGFSKVVNTNSLPQAEIQLQQPLFSGFREFLAFKEGKVVAQFQFFTEKRAEELLYQDVAQAYFNLASAQEQIQLDRDIIKTYQDRLRQLDHWLAIGRSRESEVLAARSQLAQTEAQTELSLGQEDVAQEMLKFLTGLDERLMPRPVAPPQLPPLDEFLARAQRRSDVEAARQSLEAARLATKITARQRWPVVGLTADYYLIRSGFSQSTHYDAILAASLPIWNWGKISYQVSQSSAAEDSSAQALSLARRSAERDVRTAYRTLQWAVDSVDALAKAASLGKDNVEAQSRDYRSGLVTNIDVLNTINQFQSVQTALTSAKWNAAYAAVQLEVAAGLSPTGGTN